MTPPAETVRPIHVGFVVHALRDADHMVLVGETIRRLGPAIVPTVFCLDSVGQFGEELVSQGVDEVGLNRRPGWDFRASRRLASAARERRIEVFHAHQDAPFFYAALAKLQLWSCPKLILTGHGRPHPDAASPVRRALNRIVLDRCADAVNACCRFSARALCEVDGFAGHRIEVIENGIDVAPYVGEPDKAELRRELGLDPERRYIVHVARHYPVKDQATLLRAFATVAREYPGVDLLMVGDGPLRGDLEKLASGLGVAERVRFLGARSDVSDWLRGADLFALTSVSEAASLTLLEAMAAGLPVVVTDVGGNPEIVRPDVEGLLFPRGDAEHCADCFRQLLDDPDYAETLGQLGRDRVWEKYRLEQTVAAYYDLYRRLVGR